MTIDEIAGPMDMPEQRAIYWLTRLIDHDMVRSTRVQLVGIMYGLEQKGRQILITQGLLSQTRNLDTERILVSVSPLDRIQISKTARAFLDLRRPPPDLRPKLDFGFRYFNQSVELLEIRPKRDDKPGKTEHAFAVPPWAPTQPCH